VAANATRAIKDNSRSKPGHSKPLTRASDGRHNQQVPEGVPMMNMKSLLAAAGALLACALSPAAELQPGDAAPDFSLGGSDGKTYKLSDYKGKQAVVLAWFPKAFTGG